MYIVRVQYRHSTQNTAHELIRVIKYRFHNKKQHMEFKPVLYQFPDGQKASAQGKKY